MQFEASYQADPIVSIIVGLLIYGYFAYSMQVIAKKTHTPNDWMAWIPIVNFFLLLKIAGKPAWWFLLMFLPLVNLVIAIIIWMNVAEKCHKPRWVGLLLLVPFINILIPGYLAFSKDTTKQ